MNIKETGNLGEKVACYYLESKGYRILDKNYIKEWSSTFKGEIDIVAEKDKTVIFAEVKALTQPDRAGFYFSPEDKVDFQKQKKLIRLAESWLKENNISLESKWRIDVVSVKLSPDFQKAKIRHLENAVSQMA